MNFAPKPCLCTYLFFSIVIAQSQNTANSSTLISEADTAKSSKREIYRASNSRTNDIIYTKLEVTFDWNKAQLKGKASLQIKPYFYPTNSLYLNAKGMNINSVEVYETSLGVDSKQAVNSAKASGTKGSKVLSASYVYENDSLKINLGKMFSSSQQYTVMIDYVAKPNELKKGGGSNAITDDKGLYFINPSGDNPFKMPQIWTQGETQANSAWFPTIDSPNEKMTQEILMTVDQKYTTLSNGTLISSKPVAGGLRTDHWKLDQAHSPYLAMMAVGEFKKVIDSPWNGKEISYYVEKEYETHAKAIFGDTKEMIEFYSKKLGVPYPWSKYSQIVVRDYVSGAMENTSATLHGDFMVYQTTRETIDGKKGNSVIAHELFHQWFGDLVTSESWSNLPLNESFATYGEYLWEEYKFGRDAADQHHWQSKQGYLSGQKEVNLIRYDYEDKEDMFDRFSYNKGGQVLHMLRKAVGDEAFFASLKKYLETNSYKPAEIHHLRLAFEEVTGTDMNWFFNQWFLNKGRPNLKVTKAYDLKEKNVELTVEQLQDLKTIPLYTLPLEIDIYLNGKKIRKHLVITEQKQSFKFAIETEPKLINFDADRQLLCDLDYAKTKEEYMYQYKNAPLFEDRMEALKKLESKLNEQDVFELFKDAALNDKLAFMRIYAINKLDKAPEEKAVDLKQLYTTVYSKDLSTTTRAKALGALNQKYAGDAEVMALNEKALTEQSYAICAEGLESIIKNNPTIGLKKAKTFENENSKSLLFVIANCYANQGADDEMAFFHQAIKRVNGFEIITFSNAYGKTAKRCVKTENVLMAGKDLEILAKGANKYTKYATTKALKDLLTVWEEKENRLNKLMEVSKSSEKEFDDLNAQLKQATELKEKLTVMYNAVK